MSSIPLSIAVSRAIPFPVTATFHEFLDNSINLGCVSFIWARTSLEGFRMVGFVIMIA